MSVWCGAVVWQGFRSGFNLAAGSKMRRVRLAKEERFEASGFLFGLRRDGMESHEREAGVG